MKFLRWAGVVLLGFLAAVVINNAPQSYQTFASHSSGLGGVSLTGLTLPVVLFLLVNYFLIALMGYSLASPFFEGGAVKGRGLHLIASFFIGYVCLAGVVRLVSFVCPYHAIYGPVVGAELLITIFAGRMKRTGETTESKQASSWVIFLKGLAGAAVLVIFFAAVLLLQVRQAEFSWVGHGVLQYTKFQSLWYFDHLQHFPLISRHYDELIVHYFLCMPIQGALWTIIVWWITLGLVKTSVFVFLWVVLRRVGLSAFLALLGVLFLFLGTSALAPWRYYLLFDSSNFLFFTVHSGRVAGIGMVIFWIVNYLREDALSRPLSLLMIIFAGLGLTALPETNALWVFVLLPWMFPLKKQETSPDWRWIYFSLAAMLLMYSLPFDLDVCIIARGLAAGIALLACRRIFLARSMGCLKDSDHSSVQAKIVRRGLLILALSILFGMIFMGNLFRDNGLSRWTFQKLEPAIGLVERRELSEDLLSKGHFGVGDFRELGSYNEYCKGPLGFAAYYGMILIMIALTPYLYRRLGTEGSSLDERVYRIFAYLVTIMPFLFFLMDFTNFGPQRAWLKSRFLEVPVYFVIFVFLYFLARAASRLERQVAGLVLVVYIITPFMVNQRPLHIWENARSLMQDGFLSKKGECPI